MEQFFEKCETGEQCAEVIKKILADPSVLIPWEQRPQASILPGASECKLPHNGPLLKAAYVQARDCLMRLSPNTELPPMQTDSVLGLQELRELRQKQGEPVFKPRVENPSPIVDAATVRARLNDRRGTADEIRRNYEYLSEDALPWLVSQKRYDADLWALRGDVKRRVDLVEAHLREFEGVRSEVDKLIQAMRDIVEIIMQHDPDGDCLAIVDSNRIIGELQRWREDSPKDYLCKNEYNTAVLVDRRNGLMLMDILGRGFDKALMSLDAKRQFAQYDLIGLLKGRRDSIVRRTDELIQVAFGKQATSAPAETPAGEVRPDTTATIGRKQTKRKRRKKTPPELLKETRERHATKFLVENPDITARDLAKKLDCDASTVVRLEAWKKKGVLHRDPPSGATRPSSEEDSAIDAEAIEPT